MVEVDGFNTAYAPEPCIWRIGHKRGPADFSRTLEPDDLLDDTAGNRYDSPIGSYRVLYGSSSRFGCFMEVLARFRKDRELPSEIEEEWQSKGWMNMGTVPAAWRSNRRIVQLQVEEGSMFADVDRAGTIRRLRDDHGSTWTALGVDDFDRRTPLDRDRRITRWISWAIHDYVVERTGKNAFAGIRYVSRVDGTCENWAMFEGTHVSSDQIERVEETDPDLFRAAATLGVRVF